MRNPFHGCLQQPKAATRHSGAGVGADAGWDDGVGSAGEDLDLQQMSLESELQSQAFVLLAAESKMTSSR